MIRATTFLRVFVAGTAPKFDDGEVLGSYNFPFGRPKAPEEVAALTVMLSSPSVHYLSGTVIDMDGGGQWAG